MTLFRKKTADEMQDNMINLIEKYKDSLNLQDHHQNKIKSSDFKAQVGLGVMGLSGMGALGGIIALGTAAIAAPVAVALTTGAVTVGFAAMGYMGIQRLIQKHHEGVVSKNNHDDFVYKAGSTFEKKMNALLSNTEGQSALKSDDMLKLKRAVLNDNGTSLDSALKEINLPDTKFKKVFKEDISGNLESSLERIMPKSFYSTRKESLKTGLGLTMAMGGAVAAVGGLSAASLMVTGLGVIGGVGALAWSGIRMAAEALENRQIKKHFENQNKEDVATRKNKLSI